MTTPTSPQPAAHDALAPLTDALLAPFPHGFFGRAGGVSNGLYARLNCGLGSRDDRAAVLENRRRVAQHLGQPASPLLTCHQVHSADAVVVDRPWAPGDQPKADALVTCTPGVVLGALAADCMPLLFADHGAGVVAAAHAGWKGALAGIAESTLDAMQRLGARRNAIRVVIGPSIGVRNYEVGPEFRATFVTADPGNAAFFTVPADGARPHFDLTGYMLARLARAGVAACAVGRCTYAEPDRYFSFRRATHRGEADYGRQVSAITLPT